MKINWRLFIKQNYYWQVGLWIASVFFTMSCRDFNGIQALGKHFGLMEGDKLEDNVIIYCSNYNCHGGMYVVPTYKRHYDDSGGYAEYAETAEANKNWIIVRTVEVKGKRKNYWIVKQFDLENVDCSKANCDSIAQTNVIGPLTVDDFNIKTEELKIDLHFKE